MKPKKVIETEVYKTEHKIVFKQLDARIAHSLSIQLLRDKKCTTFCDKARRGTYNNATMVNAKKKSMSLKLRTHLATATPVSVLLLL